MNTNQINRPPCIECKHLTYNKAEFTELRLTGDTTTYFKIKCTKHIMKSSTHTMNFLSEPVTPKTEKETFARHISSCIHFEPST